MQEALITDLGRIQAIAVLQQMENQSLESVIKKMPVAQVDQLVHPVAEKITRQIDCTQCGNCCKVQEPGVNKEEISRLAALRSMPETVFKDEFVAYTAEGASFLCRQPCIFLDGRICGIYTDRPWSCSDYPGLERPRIKWRWKQVMENYTICPIVFNTVEQLRAQLL